ncbi:uncharacterized protein pxb isoform X2 [Planococcus citri]|uniref:uncharacterized protein pxb isoform X2 n=1 Tax=Planococcus citri TaxID=170843 RepID=UPI0031F87E17
MIDLKIFHLDVKIENNIQNSLYVMEIGSPANDAGEADNSLPALWELDSPEYECDCPGPPPPLFKIPPPPRPPFLSEVADCSEVTIADYESCDNMPVIDAGYHSNPAIPTLTILVICSALLLAGALIVFGLAWKHKKKMQNFLPCKSSPQNRCDVAHGNGLIYEDLANVGPRAVQQPSSIEMLDVKSHHNSYVISHSPVFICSPSSRPESQYCPPPRQEHRYCSQDLYNPVYEELSNGSVDRGESDAESECIRELTRSDDEFAEDELSLGEHHHLPAVKGHSGASSLQGSTGNDLCRDVDSSDADDRSRFLCHRGPCLRAPNGRNLSLPPNRRSRQYPSKYQNRSQQSLPDQKRPRSLDRRRDKTWRNKVTNNNNPAEPNEFHEGLLLDALYQMYPNVSMNPHTNSGRAPPRLPYILPVSSNAQQPTIVNPYESVPVLNHLRQHNQRQHHHQQQSLYGHRHQYYPAGVGVAMRTPQDNFTTTFRQQHKPMSQDSDSGYSNNTSGGRGSSSSRSKNETLKRISTHSEFPLS